ncbi:MAG: ATP-binding protein [Clostridiales bacterium]|nr:ATP-binding protein [Clostridiales bacterium]
MKIFYGPKGTGKTKAIIDDANKRLETAKGHVIFITDTNRYTYDLKYQIRFLDVTQFAIQGMDGLRGFLKGIVAASGDNEYIYLDGIARIADKPLSELGNVFAAMEKLEKDFDVKFVLTCSASKEDLPDFVLKYVE